MQKLDGKLLKSVKLETHEAAASQNYNLKFVSAR